MTKSSEDAALPGRSFAILVPSCDRYSDLWEGFVSTLRARWHPVAADIFVVSNFKPCEVPGTTAICVGEDVTWSANLLKVLHQIPHDYVLMFLEDLFLKSDIDSVRVQTLINRCIDNGWDYLRLNPTPGPAAPVTDGVGPVPPGDFYRTSTVLSLWRRSALLSVLRPDESAWDFEVYGSARTDHLKAWYACSEWNLPFHNLVIKGKIDKRAYRQLQQDGTAPVTKRLFMSGWEDWVYRMRGIRMHLVQILIPQRARRPLQLMFKR